MLNDRNDWYTLVCANRNTIGSRRAWKPAHCIYLLDNCYPRVQQLFRYDITLTNTFGKASSHLTSSGNGSLDASLVPICW